MITPEKIDDWIREVEERPSSASVIIRFIGNRLIDLTKWNDELQAENLALRSEKKVEEYEERIANLEYQTGLLKRQLSGDIDLLMKPEKDALPTRLENQNVNVILYHPQGQVLRINLPLPDLESFKFTGHLPEDSSISNQSIRLLAVPDNEELLFVFDSGRTVAMPVDSIPAVPSDQISWQRSFLQPPLGTEELAFIQPIARMALFDHLIQISRKACVKKIKESLFETYLLKSYIGTGIKSPPDKTCDLLLSGKNEKLVLVSKEGVLRCLDIDSLPATIEVVLQLSVTDHIITAFTISSPENPGTSILFITQNGKVIQRSPDWLEVATSFKTKGQLVFSQERRTSGVRLVGAASASEEDWGIALKSDGCIDIFRIRDRIGAGSILGERSEITILDFTTFLEGK